MNIIIKKIKKMDGCDWLMLYGIFVALIFISMCIYDIATYECVAWFGVCI